MMGCLRIRERFCKLPLFLSEVRNELGEWKEAMEKEYRSLVHETKAIEPVDLSMLNPEMVEFVPGKLVTVRKAGPNGGKK